MGNSFFSDIVKTFGFIILFIVVIFCVNFVVGQGGLEASISKIDASGVVIIKSNDSIAQDYFFINFAGIRICGCDLLTCESAVCWCGLFCNY